MQLPVRDQVLVSARRGWLIAVPNIGARGSGPQGNAARPFGEPPINRSQQFARLLHLALVARRGQPASRAPAVPPPRRRQTDQVALFAAALAIATGQPGVRGFD
jgi:hypothetical protein